MTSAVRPGFKLAPVVETWDATVYQITGKRTAYLVVPRISATGFDEALNAGQIDSTITDYLNTPDTGRTLDQHTLMLTLGLYDRLGDPQNLAAPERDPATGLPGHARSREDKNQDQQLPHNTSTTTTITTPARTVKWPILVGAGFAVIALIGIGAAVASMGGGESASGSSGSSGSNDLAAYDACQLTTPDDLDSLGIGPQANVVAPEVPRSAICFREGKTLSKQESTTTGTTTFRFVTNLRVELYSRPSGSSAPLGITPQAGQACSPSNGPSLGDQAVWAICDVGGQSDATRAAWSGVASQVVGVVGLGDTRVKVAAIVPGNQIDPAFYSIVERAVAEFSAGA